MFTYYLGLALRSLKRNVVLTILMVTAIGVGIGASMTVLTTLHLLSADPIPWKSARLFVPLIDNQGPQAVVDWDIRSVLSYTDVQALTRAHRGLRQTALYNTVMTVIPPSPAAKPLEAHGLAVYSDFFRMFDVPFGAGGPWSSSDDDNRANVVVLGPALAEKLFPGQSAVGQTVRLNEQDYKIVGVLKAWNPHPRFYNFWSDKEEDVFLPFSTAIDRQLEQTFTNACNKVPDPGWQGLLKSDCIWISFWVELRSAAEAGAYHEFLYNYATDQQRSGRFNWAPHVELYDVHGWLARMKVVPDEMRISTIVAFGFLLVCLLNSVGLMLAKFSARIGDFSVRRALGASKRDVFYQCMVECAVIGLTGGALGLVLTALGLQCERESFGSGPWGEYLSFATHLDAPMVGATVVIALLAALSAGLYPTWRASRVQPAGQLKSQ